MTIQNFSVKELFNFLSRQLGYFYQVVHTTKKRGTFVTVVGFRKIFFNFGNFPIVLFSPPSFLRLENLNSYWAFRTRRSLLLFFFFTFLVLGSFFR